MKRWLSAALIIGLAISISGCAVRRIHDYIFDVRGVVTAEDGTPLVDAEVTLEVNGPVYEAITPVKVVKRVTDSTGGFVFMYISHERGAKYTIRVAKEGFAPQTVSGGSPPASHLAIRLTKTDSIKKN